MAIFKWKTVNSNKIKFDIFCFENVSFIKSHFCLLGNEQNWINAILNCSDVSLFSKMGYSHPLFYFRSFHNPITNTCSCNFNKVYNTEVQMVWLGLEPRVILTINVCCDGILYPNGSYLKKLGYTLTGKWPSLRLCVGRLPQTIRAQCSGFQTIHYCFVCWMLAVRPILQYNRTLRYAEFLWNADNGILE